MAAKKQKRKQKNKEMEAPRPPRKFSARIQRLNDHGLGEGEHEGVKLTVAKTLPGELVELEYNPSRPRKERIRLLNILEPSPARVEAPCRYFNQCGGCQIQHLSYQDQLVFKKERVLGHLQAYPELADVTVHDVQGMPDPFHYRNKTQAPLQQQGDKVIYGLFKSRTNRLVSIENCPVETRDANLVLQTVQEWAAHYQIPIYDEHTGEGLLRHVVVRKSIFTNQLMVILVATEQRVPDSQPLLHSLQARLSSLKSLQLNYHPGDSATILGKKNLLIWGEPYIAQQVGKIKLRIYPHTRMETNSVQLIKILEKIRRLVQPSPQQTMLHLFSGIGAYALPLAEQLGKVIGVTPEAEEAEAARQNAYDNEIDNADFRSGPLLRELKNLLQADQGVDLLLATPPKKGLEKPVIRLLSQAPVKTLIYLSPNPRTMSRDLAALKEAGYRLEEIFPFDSFPQTYQVECLAALHHSDGDTGS